MEYLEFLARLHDVLRPPAYLEIGVRRGDSLALARCPAIGIDPAYRLDPEIKRALRDDVTLFRRTSDDHFARRAPLKALGGRRIGLAFIDGMHLVEFALRDFINVERRSDWTSAIVFDDVLPRDPAEAARDRRTRAWTGDVYKMLAVLREHRPDLITLRVDTQPTGLLLVLALSPRNRVLRERYEAIVAEHVTPDPQHVPDDVLGRRGALDPAAVLEASFWETLRSARDAGASRADGFRALRRAVRRDLGAATVPGRLRRLTGRA